MTDTAVFDPSLECERLCKFAREFNCVLEWTCGYDAPNFITDHISDLDDIVYIKFIVDVDGEPVAKCSDIHNDRVIEIDEGTIYVRWE